MQQASEKPPVPANIKYGKNLFGLTLSFFKHLVFLRNWAKMKTLRLNFQMKYSPADSMDK